MNIEDIKLELVALQKLDTQNAINYGAKSKSDWFKQIITNEDNDVIAESIIDLSREYFGIYTSSSSSIVCGIAILTCFVIIIGSGIVVFSRLNGFIILSSICGYFALCAIEFKIQCSYILFCSGNLLPICPSGIRRLR